MVKGLFIKIKPVLLKIIYLIVAITILIASLCSLNRLVLFKKLFNNFLFNTSSLPLVLFFFCLSTTIIYNLVFVILYYCGLKDKIKKIDDKTDIVQYIFKCIALIFAVLMFIFTPCTVIGESMSKTLHTNDKVITYNLFYKEKKDDIIVFNARANSSEEFYIKRVIAIENDNIEYDGTNLFVNGNDVGLVTQREYLNIITSIDITTTKFTVPKNKVLVFGDNRPGSLDSRAFGFIDSNDIYGHVFLRIYPYFGTIGKDVIE